MQRNTIFFIVAATLSVVEISTTIGVAATKLNKYQMLYVQFLSS